MEATPKKVQQALDKLGIVGVVGGYSTMVGNALTPNQAAFTCWDANGKVVCVLYKAPGSEWSLKPVPELPKRVKQ